MANGYSRQSAGEIVTGQTMEASDFNNEFNDVLAFADASTGHDHDGTAGGGASIILTSSVTGTLPLANGGTNATTASAARTSLGVAIGTDVQAFDAGLLSIAGLTTLADRMIYTTASDTYAVATLTASGRNLIDDASTTAQRTTLGLGTLAVANTINNTDWSGTDLAVVNGGTGSSTATAARTALGLVIGTDVQAEDAGLTSIATLGTGADEMVYTTGVDTYAATTITAAGRALIDDAAASNQRTTLGLVIGTDVQAFDAQLADIAALAVTDSNFIVGDGANWVAESGATARTSMGAVGAADSNTFSNTNTFSGVATFTANPVIDITGSLGSLTVASNISADAAVVSRIEMVGHDDGANDTIYTRIESVIDDNTDGTENSHMNVSLMLAGTLTNLLTLDSTAGLTAPTAITTSGAITGVSVAGTMIATQADMEAASSTTTIVTPNRQRHHPGHPKAWGQITLSGGTPTLTTSYNVTSIADAGVGNYTVTLADDFATANYSIVTSMEYDGSAVTASGWTSKAAGTFTIRTFVPSTNAAVDASVDFVCFGDN